MGLSLADHARHKIEAEKAERERKKKRSKPRPPTRPTRQSPSRRAAPATSRGAIPKSPSVASPGRSRSRLPTSRGAIPSSPSVVSPGRSSSRLPTSRGAIPRPGPGRPSRGVQGGGVFAKIGPLSGTGRAGVTRQPEVEQSGIGGVFSSIGGALKDSIAGDAVKQLVTDPFPDMGVPGRIGKNLNKNIIETAVGLGSAVPNIASSVVRDVGDAKGERDFSFSRSGKLGKEIAEGMASDYMTRYGRPIIRGDWGELAHQQIENPGFLLMDAAAGAGAVGTTARVVGKAGTAVTGGATGTGKVNQVFQKMGERSPAPRGTERVPGDPSSGVSTGVRSKVDVAPHGPVQGPVKQADSEGLPPGGGPDTPPGPTNPPQGGGGPPAVPPRRVQEGAPDPRDGFATRFDQNRGGDPVVTVGRVDDGTGPPELGPGAAEQRARGIGAGESPYPGPAPPKPDWLPEGRGRSLESDVFDEGALPRQLHVEEKIDAPYPGMKTVEDMRANPTTIGPDGVGIYQPIVYRNRKAYSDRPTTRYAQKGARRLKRKAEALTRGGAALKRKDAGKPRTVQHAEALMEDYKSSGSVYFESPDYLYKRGEATLKENMRLARFELDEVTAGLTARETARVAEEVSDGVKVVSKATGADPNAVSMAAMLHAQDLLNDGVSGDPFKARSTITGRWTQRAAERRAGGRKAKDMKPSDKNTDIVWNIPDELVDITQAPKEFRALVGRVKGMLDDATDMTIASGALGPKGAAIARRRQADAWRKIHEPDSVGHPVNAEDAKWLRDETPTEFQEPRPLPDGVKPSYVEHRPADPKSQRKRFDGGGRQRPTSPDEIHRWGGELLDTGVFDADMAKMAAFVHKRALQRQVHSIIIGEALRKMLPREPNGTPVVGTKKTLLERGYKTDEFEHVPADRIIEMLQQGYDVAQSRKFADGSIEHLQKTLSDELAANKATSGSLTPVPRVVLDIWEDFNKGPTRIGSSVDYFLNPWRRVLLTTAPRWYLNNLYGNSIMFGMANSDDMRAVLVGVQRAIAKKSNEGTVPSYVQESFMTDIGKFAVQRRAPIRSAMNGLIEFNRVLENFVRRAHYHALEEKKLKRLGASREVRSNKELRARVMGGVAEDEAMIARMTGRPSKISDEAVEAMKETTADPKILAAKAGERPKTEFTDDMAKMGFGETSPEEMLRAMGSVDGSLKREVMNEFNRTIGNYTRLRPNERRYLRRIFPFYSWFRVIGRVMASMPINMPVRLDIMAHASNEVNEVVNGDEEAVPLYLRGLIRGGDEEGIGMRAGSLNPYATPVGVMEGIGQGDIGKTVSSLGQLSNPGITALTGLAFNRDPFGNPYTGPKQAGDKSQAAFGGGYIRENEITGEAERTEARPNALEMVARQIPHYETARKALGAGLAKDDRSLYGTTSLPSLIGHGLDKNKTEAERTELYWPAREDTSYERYTGTPDIRGLPKWAPPLMGTLGFPLVSYSDEGKAAAAAEAKKRIEDSQKAAGGGSKKKRESTPKPYTYGGGGGSRGGGGGSSSGRYNYGG